MSTAISSHELSEGVIAHALAEPVLVLRSATPPAGPAGRAVDRLAAILDALVRVSSVDRPCDDEDVRLDDLVDGGVEGVKVVGELDTTVRGDRGLLRTLVAELLANVRDHGGGVARVSAWTGPDGAWSLVVEDDGPGFPTRLRPLGRLPESQHAGVGLVICDRIARAHGGRLDARTAAGGGARVAVEVPGRP